ncbi:MAG: hypothetical protein ABIH22_02040 [Candidatus Margulisiibacteriota bacterium]
MFRPQPTPVPQKVAPPAPSVLSKKTVTHYPSLREAIKETLSSKPRTIALGERHNYDLSTKLPTTIDHFAQQVMPELAAAGYRHVVFENLPFGEETDQEIERFNKGEKPGPFLFRHINESIDCRGIVQTLLMARKSGITLHGTHFTSREEYTQRIEDGTSGDIIKQRMVETIQRLREMDENMLIAVFGGAAHNNVSGDPSASIAPFFLPDFKEVDILLGRDYSPATEIEVEFNGWKTYIPESGVNLVNFPSGKSVIAMPDNDLPLSQPTCPGKKSSK